MVEIGESKLSIKELTADFYKKRMGHLLGYSNNPKAYFNTKHYSLV